MSAEIVTSGMTANAIHIVTPPQLTSRLTGYLIWRSPYPGWDAQQLDAVTFMSVAGVFFGLMLALKCRRAPSSSLTLNPTFRDHSTLLTALVTYYLYATLATVTGFWLIDVGKLWVVLGTLHNTMEFCILFVMIAATHKSLYSYFYSGLFVYWMFTQAVCIVIPWPADAIYFKFQGLILDFALCINFYRLMQANKRIALTDDDTIDEYDPSEPSVLISHVHKPPTILASSSADCSSTATITPKTALTGNSSIHLLLIAATIHTLGNCVTVVSLQKWPFLAFQFCYGVTFPIYGYYVMRQPGASRMAWFKSSKGSEAAVFGVSTLLSGIVSAVGIYVVLAYYGKD